MLRSLLIGFGFLTFSVVVAAVAENPFLIVEISGGAGAVGILLAMIFSGLLLSGDRLRANHAIKTREDRQFRNTWALYFALFAIPNVFAAIVVVSFSK